MIIELMTVS